jgi:hypothetical protein
VARRTELAFLALILAQTAHSIEEYIARLHDVFAPARFVSSLFSQRLCCSRVARGFGSVW